MSYIIFIFNWKEYTDEFHRCNEPAYKYNVYTAFERTITLTVHNSLGNTHDRCLWITTYIGQKVRQKQCFHYWYNSKCDETNNSTNSIVNILRVWLSKSSFIYIYICIQFSINMILAKREIRNCAYMFDLHVCSTQHNLLHSALG